MLKAVPGQKLCCRKNAWVSGTNRRYSVVVTQAACGATQYNHTWLKRASASASGPWVVVSRRGGTIDHPADCTKVAAVPADIRCL